MCREGEEDEEAHMVTNKQKTTAAKLTADLLSAFGDAKEGDTFLDIIELRQSNSAIALEANKSRGIFRLG